MNSVLIVRKTIQMKRKTVRTRPDQTEQRVQLADGTKHVIKTGLLFEGEDELGEKFSCKNVLQTYEDLFHNGLKSKARSAPFMTLGGTSYAAQYPRVEVAPNDFTMIPRLNGCSLPDTPG